MDAAFYPEYLWILEPGRNPFRELSFKESRKRMNTMPFNLECYASKMYTVDEVST